ncbi:MAG: ATP-dependent DNA ligase [Methanomassiliicoccales archaeon]
MPTSIASLVLLCKHIESTRSRKKKIELLSAFLRGLEAGEIKPAVLFLLGRPLPESESRALRVGYSTITDALMVQQQRLPVEMNLTIHEFASMISKIADAKGSGSRKFKKDFLSGLLARLTEEEREYVVRGLSGEMRIGANEGIMIEAIALASSIPVEEIRLANMVSGDIGLVAETALTGGRNAVKSFGINLFVPLKPMLAEMARSTDEALRLLGKAAFEFKFDGVRVQIHKSGTAVRIFSRRLTDLTNSFPDVIEMIVRSIPTQSLILEGEVIGFRDRPLPFQELMRRLMRSHQIDEIMREVPVRLFLFDILYLDGQPLLDKPYIERWRILQEVVPSEFIAPRIVTDDRDEANNFFERSLSEGHEGLIAKSLSSPYVIGKRGRHWLKIKKSMTLDLVVVAADWGYGRREGWLSDYYLAAVSGSEFEIVGKTFKGLTDDEFEWMTNKLLSIKVKETSTTVFVRPEIVVEVAFDEIQKSPRYRSGVALRFARIKSIRSDKSPEEADTLETVKHLYRVQKRQKVDS